MLWTFLSSLVYFETSICIGKGRTFITSVVSQIT
jgi:hypothetical protein